MNQQVLEAILKLLSIIAKLDGVSDVEMAVIVQFIREHCDEKTTDKYLSQFRQWSEQPSRPGEVEAICADLVKELSIQRRAVVLLRLMELVFADKDISEAEDKLIHQVTAALNISEDKYDTIRDFVVTENPYELTGDQYLIIDFLPAEKSPPKVKHIFREDLHTALAVMRLKEVEMSFIRVYESVDTLFLNGETMRNNHIYPLNSGSVIKGDNLEPLYYAEIITRFLQGGETEKISFEAKNINFFFPSGKQGLHNINISEGSGKLVALMGGSGAGKSTLLNVLNGNYAPQEGQILINGIDINANPKGVEGVIGYVPQDDLLIEDLTVYENLFYAGKLCFGDLDDVEIDRRVNQTLLSLGLYEARDLKVGNALAKTISGGQRKRLNIGLELLRQPAVMFVDEPTSGLSSRDSENIMDLLRELTLMGKLIFVVIHQPSSDIFKMFDKLVILDVGGFPIYYGNPVEGVSYFKKLDDHINAEAAECITCGNVNPEQIFNIIESKIVDEFGHQTPLRKYSPTHWNEVYKGQVKITPVTPVSEPPKKTLNIPSRFKQFRIFAARDFRAKLGNTQYLAINLLQAPALALLLAYILRYDKINDLADTSEYHFYENVNLPSYIFIAIIVVLFMGLTVSAEEIIKDAKILKREAFLHLSRTSYLLSKILILFGFSFIQSLVFTLLGNWIIGIKGLDLQYFLVLFSSACFANLLGLNISATFNSAITIYILIPILLIPQLILGGIVVRFDQVNPHIGSMTKVPMVGEIMTSRWAFEALMVSQYKDNKYERQFYPIEKRKNQAIYKHQYYLHTLESKANYVVKAFREGQTQDPEYKAELDLLYREITAENKLAHKLEFAEVEQLKPGAFTDRIGELLLVHLDVLITHYTNQANAAYQELDKLKATRYDTPEKKIELQKLQMDYENKAVSEMVENRALGSDPIIEHENQLIRKFRPVHFDPEHVSSWLDFRTHFFAPKKFFLGLRFPTLNFNLGVIWGMTLLLYVTLYFTALRRLLRLFNFSMRKKQAA